jgi:hypothetical protein
MKSQSYRFLPYLACLLAGVAADLWVFPATTAFPDEQRFLASAGRLAASGEFWVFGDRAWEMPGTALFFAPAVWLFGPHAAIVPIRLIQALLVVIQCALIAFIAQRIFRKDNTAFIAACIAALYPFLIFYQGLLLSETLFDTLLLAGMAALYWWRERRLRIDLAFVVACLCFVAATLTKATLTVLPPILLAVTAWCAGAKIPRVVTVIAAASCLYAAFMSPWWIRNATLLHNFVPFTTSGALNLYLGNNPRNLNAGADWSTDADPEVVARINAMPDEMARQSAFSRLAVDYIRSNPDTFLRNAAKKFVRFWNITPNATQYQSRFYALISALSFGPVLALAIVCAVRRRRQWRLLAPLYLVIGYFTLLHVVTIASLRYRLPLEPLLIILAAEPLGAIIALIWPGATQSSVE